MDFKSYCGLSKRTLADLGSQMLNSVHCSIGMSSETYELFEAIHKKDDVNVGEEIADKLFYIANYINVNNLDISFDFTTVKKEVECPLGLDTTGASFVTLESELLDYDKKWMAYGKEKNIDVIKPIVEKLLISYNNLILEREIDASDIMQKNINKLKARFPESFSEEAAINRDLIKEREILEGK